MSLRSIVLTGLGLASATVETAQAGRFESIIVTGVITQSPGSGHSTTVDTQGVFSPASTDLAGAKVEILEQYEPEHFQAGEPDGNSAVIYQVKAPAPHLPGVTLISISIRGVQRVFTSAAHSNVITGSVYPYSISQITTADAAGNQTTVHLAFTAPVIFSSPLPAQSIVKGSVVQDITFIPADNSSEEYLSFVAASASR